MKRILLVRLGGREETVRVPFLGEEVEVIRRGCGEEPKGVEALIVEHDGRVDAIGLEGIPLQLELGSQRRPHRLGAGLARVARTTPVVDGSGVRPGLERWAVTLAQRSEPGIFSGKRILMVPGVNHGGLAHALGRRASDLRYADPLVYFGLPPWPGIGSRRTLRPAAPRTLDQLAAASFQRLAPLADRPFFRRVETPFRWADVLAGDVATIRRFSPQDLRGKIVVVEWADDEDVDDLRQRGASHLMTVMPSLNGDSLGRWPAAAIEALLAARRRDPSVPPSEDLYLDLMAEVEWMPAIQVLHPEEAEIRRFAFIIHPLDVSFIHRHPPFRWTRFFPDRLVEAVAAFMPPMPVSRMVGARSPATGQRVEGYLISLGATPRQMLWHSDRFTYQRLLAAARLAERWGARIMGLGAFTSVVGDAGITVAREADIAVTSGNSLTVAATLEAAKQAVRRMGVEDLAHGRAMVVGATGSIGSVCARLLAQAVRDVVLVSIEPERLIELKRAILAETPGARVTLAIHSDELMGDCDLVVTATSAFGQRVVDITRAKPGAVICDVARPPDIGADEAALRPDVLVVESGEVLIPGEIDFGYDIGLPAKTSYACLAETALLAMEGRFEDYTLGRRIEMERVKEIYHLFQKHGFQIAGLRSLGRYVTDEELAQKRRLAEALRKDPELLARTRGEAAARLAEIPAAAKGVRANGGLAPKDWAWLAGGAAALALLAARRRGSRRSKRHHPGRRLSRKR